MIEALGHAPATLIDVEGGTLSPGCNADFILFRPDSSWIISGANFTSDSRITPFESQPVQGLVDATYVNGVAVFIRN